ncbi:MAG: NADP-dependent oxidoreductase [Bryobacteraceae bacterium]
MKAMRLTQTANGTVLVEADILRPKPGEGELVVKVFAAGVTPTEAIWYPTTHTKTGDPRKGAIPTHEFSGEIAEVGHGVTGFEPGQAVYGMNDWFADGALAEYCVTKPEWIAAKPKSLNHVDAASVPIGALTAWQGLVDRARLRPGERVLIQGGAGAVGVYAIQLAHWRGAHVAATVSAHNARFAAELGADKAIDYKSVPFDREAPDVDVVFDTVGGETLQRSWSLLGPGGRMVTIAAGGDPAQDERTKKAFFIVEPNARQLVEIGAMLDAGVIRAVVDRVVSLAEAPGVYAGTLKKRGRGRVVVSVAESA